MNYGGADRTYAEHFSDNAQLQPESLQPIREFKSPIEIETSMGLAIDTRQFPLPSFILHHT